jgi:hypothetical protein
MLFDFGLTTHFQDDPGLAPFESLILAILAKTHLHERHLNRTIQLYRSEYDLSLNELGTARDRALVDAQLKYDEVIKSVGDTDEGRLYADHESGWGEITSHFAHQEENLQKEMMDLVDYFNKSALVVVYSLFESSFRDVCLTLQDAFAKKIGLKHMNSANYLKSMIAYLELVLEVDVTLLAPHISKIEHLQFLRNRIVHEGGIITLDKADEKLLNQIVVQSRQSVTIENDEHSNLSSIRVKKVEYIIGHYELVRTFFRDTLYLIDSITNHSLLLARVKHLFGFVSNNLTTRIKKVEYGPGYVKLVFELQFFKDSVQYPVGCTVNISKSKQPKIDFTNQLDSSTEELDRVINYLESYPGQITETLKGFAPVGAFSEISFLIFNIESSQNEDIATG